MNVVNGRQRMALGLLPLGLASCLTLGREAFLLPQADGPGGPVEEARTRKDPRTGAVVEYSERLVLPDGRRLQHGVERRWYPDGALRAERHFEEGVAAGTWRSWHEDGTLRSEYTFEPRGEATPMRFWHQSGTLAAEGLARAGRREGPWTYWYPSGAVREEGSYAANERDGEWSFFREDGSLISRGRYANGKRLGPWEHGSAPADPAPTHPTTSDMCPNRVPALEGENVCLEGQGAEGGFAGEAEDPSGQACPRAS